MRSNADGVPIQADGLPIGAGVCRGMSSGADTEVRPPATRVLGPLGALWGGARIGSFRSRFHGSPWDRFSFDSGPAERTRRSAPPPSENDKRCHNETFLTPLSFPGRECITWPGVAPAARRVTPGQSLGWPGVEGVVGIELHTTNVVWSVVDARTDMMGHAAVRAKSWMRRTMP